MNKYKRPRAIKKYSAALMFFKSTAKDLNLQKLSMQKPSDYLRSDIADIKKDTTHAKKMIKAILLYTQKKEQINNVTDQTQINRTSNEQPTFHNKSNHPDPIAPVADPTPNEWA